MPQLRTITIHYHNGDTNHTSINPNISDKEIYQYYLNQIYTTEINGKEIHKKITNISIHPNIFSCPKCGNAYLSTIQD